MDPRILRDLVESEINDLAVIGVRADAFKSDIRANAKMDEIGNNRIRRCARADRANRTPSQASNSPLLRHQGGRLSFPADFLIIATTLMNLKPEPKHMRPAIARY
jgi:hypothetical protein